MVARSATANRPRSVCAIMPTRFVPPLRELGLRILVEPGRFIVGNAGVLLTRVLILKRLAQKKFAIVDAGMNDLIRPALYQSYHEIVPVKECDQTQASVAKDRYRRAGLRIRRFLRTRSRNARSPRRRSARDHERRRLRIYDGFELQLAAVAGRSAGPW